MSQEDAIETIVGRFGKYQTWILVLISLGRYPVEFQLNNVVFIIPSVEYKCLDESAFNASNYCPCQNPEYDQSTILSSVTTEWNLICERTSLASLAQSMLQVGILAGSVIFGHISDRYGRKISVLISLSLQVLFVALSAFSANYWMFLICRFMIGATVGGTMLCTYVLLIELSGKSFRPYLVGLGEISFITGYIALPIIAYFVREWRYLQLVTSLPWVFVISYYWLLPESPRWLISIGKKKEAVEILSYIAKKNKRPTENIEAIVDKIENEKPGSFIDLFNTPKIRIYTIIMAFIWMFCSHTFFGVNQYIGRLQGNLYLNVILSASFLAPGLVLVVFGTLYLLLCLGRYPTETQLNNVVFIIPGVQYTCLDENAANATNYCPCQTPVYEQSAIEISVTSEWNLICQKTSLASLAQSMLQVGILVGSILYGHISDRYGRKMGILLALSFEVLFISLSALSTDLWMFMVFRFLNGVTVGGTMLGCYILLIELSGKSFRPFVIALQEIPFVISYFTLPIIAYYVRQWRNLQLVTAVPWLLCFSYYWLLPESPRWLLSVGKRKEAIDILTYIAKKNKRPTEDIETDINKVEFEKPGTCIDLFKTRKMRTYSAIMAIVWMFCAHTYFGVNQYIGRLQGNLYINVMLSALCLSPGLIFVILATLYFKRKISVISSFTLAAVSLLVIIFIPNSMPSATLAFAIIGQIGAYTAFIQIYLYSCEIFPTVIRNSALGFACVFSRIGGFIAPFVVNIGIKWISILVFSSLAFCAGILCSFLPETKGIVLLNTIQEMEGSRKRKQSELST